MVPHLLSGHYPNRSLTHKDEAQTALFKDPVRSSVTAEPFKDEAQTALFKDPVRSSVAA